MVDRNGLLTRLAQGLVVGVGDDMPLAKRLCASAARVLNCDGGAVTVAYTRPERVTLASTDDAALIIEEAQDVTGQGPGPEAFTTGTYQRADLEEEEATDERWPLLNLDSVPDLLPVVVHALPLGQPASVIGVLTLYQRGTGRDIDQDAAEVVARAVTAVIMADLPGDLDGDHGVWTERAEVHQATGMVVAQLHLPEDDALALIRAHAYSHDQSVKITARAVVNNELTFSASPDQEIEST
jgi:hypothetical protein